MNKSQAAIWTLFKEAFGEDQIKNNKFHSSEMLCLRRYFDKLVKVLDKELERFEYMVV